MAYVTDSEPGRPVIAVIGAGPAGLVAALAMARGGRAVTVVAPAPDPVRLAADTRTFAALGGSVDLLKALGVWTALAPETAPLRAIRLLDARGGILRAPEVVFRASETGLEAFGANIPQAALGRVLADAVATHPAISWHATAAVTALQPMADHVEIVTSEGTRLTAALVVAADGRRSLGPAAAGIELDAWDYPQTALACVFSHSRPHQGISTEFHGLVGPLTTVPMPDGVEGPRSSLVWVDAPAVTTQRAALTPEDFTATLEMHLQGLLGAVRSVGPRATFPLSGLEARTMARHRIALVGEAGHVMPPIGAQGLNLSLRDAATLAECLDDAPECDPGAPALLETYAERRRLDIATRTRAVDALNRTLLSSVLLVDAARGLGLHALAASGTLRRMAMRQGLEPVTGRPKLMQPLHPSIEPS